VVSEETLLQREPPTGGAFAIVGLSLCALVIIVYGDTRSDWLAFLAGITMAMAMLPEEFPVVLTSFCLGAWRISRNRVLTRRVPAVEAWFGHVLS